MKTIQMHAALFVLAVIGALLTWMRDTANEADEGHPLVWERDTTEVVSVRYRAPGTDLQIQRRTDDAGSFLWGIEVGGTESTDTLVYPVGVPGSTLVGRLANLRVIRDLGDLSPEMVERFGLAEAAETIQVSFIDGQRLLAVGDSAFGGQDRYAMELATGAGYVIASDITRPLSIGEGALRERWLHRFVDDEVATVQITTPGSDAREMARTEDGEWTEVDGDVPDAAFANFMQRVDQLAIGGYGAEPGPTTTLSLLRVVYLDDAGEQLGFVELFHDDLAEQDPYFIRSETTRIVAYAVTSLAERVREGLEEVF